MPEFNYESLDPGNAKTDPLRNNIRLRHIIMCQPSPPEFEKVDADVMTEAEMNYIKMRNACIKTAIKILCTEHRWDHHPSCFKKDDWACRYQLPHRGHGATSMQDDLHFEIQRKVSLGMEYFNGSNNLILYTFRCNHDVRVLVTGGGADSVYYATKYTHKEQHDIDNVASLELIALDRRIEKEKLEPQMTVLDKARRRLSSMLYNVTSKQEIAMTLACQFVISKKTCAYTSHDFTPILLVQFINFMNDKEIYMSLERKNDYGNIDEKKDDADFEFVPSGQLLDYIGRHESLVHMCTFDFVKVFEKCTRRGREEPHVLLFQSEHPQHETHCLQKRSEKKLESLLLDVFIGPRFPDLDKFNEDDGEKKRTLYAQMTLILFKPFRKKEDLLVEMMEDEEKSQWWESFLHWKSNDATQEQLQFLENVQDYHIGKRRAKEIRQHNKNSTWFCENDERFEEEYCIHTFDGDENRDAAEGDAYVSSNIMSSSELVGSPNHSLLPPHCLVRNRKTRNRAQSMYARASGTLDAGIESLKKGMIRIFDENQNVPTASSSDKDSNGVDNLCTMFAPTASQALSGTYHCDHNNGVEDVSRLLDNLKNEIQDQVAERIQNTHPQSDDDVRTIFEDAKFFPLTVETLEEALRDNQYQPLSDEERKQQKRIKDPFDEEVELLTTPRIQLVSQRFQLNRLQHIAFSIIAHELLLSTMDDEEKEKVPTVLRFCDAHFSEKRSMYLTGEGGTGKSEVIKAALYFARCWGCVDMVKTAAPTGKAGSLIWGTTIHSLFDINITESDEDDMNGYSVSRRRRRKQQLMSACEEMKNKFACFKILIIDEVSMMDQRLLSDVNLRLQTLRESTEPFGGVFMVFSGDFYQLDPACRRPCVYEKPRRHADDVVGQSSVTDETAQNEKIRVMKGRSSTKTICRFEELLSAYNLWRLPKHCIILVENMRVLDDPLYADFTHRGRYGQWDRDYADYLNAKHCISALSSNADPNKRRQTRC